MVCGIAAYHYFRIFDNFKQSYPAGANVGAVHVLSNVEFNEAYRYVDWFLTVPLLLIETVAVMALAREEQRGLLFKLVPASALMIALGYPGEIATSTGTRVLWGVLSTIPFLYLLYVLFVELSKSLVRQPVEVVAHDQDAAHLAGRSVGRLPDRVHVPDLRWRLLRRRRRIRPAAGWLLHRRHPGQGGLRPGHLQDRPGQEPHRGLPRTTTRPATSSCPTTRPALPSA